MSYGVASVFSSLPVLTFITGLVIALVTRAKHPRRSTFAAIGFVLLAVGGVLQTVWLVVGSQLLRHGWDISRYALASTGVSVVGLICALGGWALLLVALFFSDRRSETTQLPPHHQPFPPQHQPFPPQQPPFPGQQPPGY